MIKNLILFCIFQALEGQVLEDESDAALAPIAIMYNTRQTRHGAPVNPSIRVIAKHYCLLTSFNTSGSQSRQIEILP